jgi:hypothetical protein
MDLREGYMGQRCSAPSNAIVNKVTSELSQFIFRLAAAEFVCELN